MDGQQDLASAQNKPQVPLPPARGAGSGMSSPRQQPGAQGLPQATTGPLEMAIPFNMVGAPWGTCVRPVSSVPSHRPDQIPDQGYMPLPGNAKEAACKHARAWHHGTPYVEWRSDGVPLSSAWCVPARQQSCVYTNALAACLPPVPCAVCVTRARGPPALWHPRAPPACCAHAPPEPGLHGRAGGAANRGWCGQQLGVARHCDMPRPAGPADGHGHGAGQAAAQRAGA